MTSSRRPEATAGIIAAVAALITALVGACALLYQVLGDRDNGRDNDNGTGTGAPPQAGSRTESGAPVRIPPSGSGPFEIVLTGNGIDFDVIPPRAFTDFNLAIDAYGTDRLISYPSGAGIARWTGQAAPSREECVTAINTAPLQSAPITSGSRFCLVTNNELHYAYLEFTEPAENGFRLRATIWQGV